MLRVEDSLREVLDGQLFWFPCPAEVTAFNAALQTVSARPFAKVEGERAPEIKDIPVLMPAGGEWSISWHLAAGDFVLILFCVVPPAMWRQGSDAEIEARRPQLGDAVAIPGLARLAGKTASVLAGVTIQNSSGTVVFEMTNTGISIKGNVSIEGSLDASLGVSAGLPGVGVALLTHTHGGVTTGAGSTAVPNPGT